MKTFALLTIAIAIAIWILFICVLLGIYRPDWLPEVAKALTLPTSTADLGQSMALVDGLISSMALVLGLIAVLSQMKQQADSNIIGALGTRLQFLLAESERLEERIKSLKASDKFDEALFKNMVNKKSRILKDAKEIDARLEELLKRI